MNSPGLRGISVALASVVVALVFGGPNVLHAQQRPKREPIYDEKADGEKLIADAVAKAKKENKHVLMMWGGNWCGWCYKLHDVFEKDPLVSKVIAASYVVVHIDSGGHNGYLAVRYKAQRMGGVPYLTVLDADGKLLTNQPTYPFEDGARHDPKKVLAWLEKWKPKAANS